MLLAGVALLAFLIAFGAWNREPGHATESDEPAGVASALVEPAPAVRSPVATLPEGRTTLADPLLVHGRVVDERTREPVPGLTVLLRAAEVEERTSTAADGTFAARGALPSGEIEALLFDLEAPVAEVRRSADVPRSEAWTIAVAIGPTVPLAFPQPAEFDPAQWRARLVETTRPATSAGELEVRDASLQMIAPDPARPAREWEWLALRAGDPPWIRYPAASFESSGDWRVQAELDGEIPGRRGSAPLRSTVGVQLPVLFGRLEARASVHGRIVDERGAPITARVALLPSGAPGDDELRPPSWSTAETGASGEFLVAGVEPGSARLCVFAPDRPAHERELRLSAGRNEIAEPIALGAAAARKPQPAKAEPARSEKGPPPVGLLQLRSPRGGNLLPDTITAYDERAFRDLSRRGPRPADLPPGLPADPIEATWISVLDRRADPWPAIRPARAMLEPPFAALPFASARASRTLRLRPIDRTSRRDLGRYQLSFEAGGALLGVPPIRDFQRAAFPFDAPIELSLWRNGLQPVFAERSDLREEEGRLVLECDARPGWGAVLWMRVGRRPELPKETALKLVVASQAVEKGELRVAPDKFREKLSGLQEKQRADALAGALAMMLPPTLAQILERPPLAGVRVIDGDTPVATSDREGVARIATARPPERLVLVAEGWQLVAIERLPGGTNAVQRYVVWLERE